MSSKIDEAVLTRLGQQFGAQIAALVSTNAAYAVTVESVDDTYAYVTTFGGDKATSVSLRLLNVANSMLKVTPSVGSIAVVTNINGNVDTRMFLAFSAVDKIEFEQGLSKFTLIADPENSDNDAIEASVGKSSVRVTRDQIAFNGGDNKGLVLADKLVNRLNNIENSINALKRVFGSWVVVPNDGGSALKTAVTAWSTDTVSLTKANDFTNDKIKQ